MQTLHLTLESRLAGVYRGGVIKNHVKDENHSPQTPQRAPAA